MSKKPSNHVSSMVYLMKTLKNIRTRLNLSCNVRCYFSKKTKKKYDIILLVIPFCSTSVI